MIPYKEIKLLTSISGEESQSGEAGASGKVVMGMWKGKVVAVKLMHYQEVENFGPGWRKGIQEVNESKRREIEKEAENYSKLNHPNIIKFYGLTRVGNCVHIVIEYVEGGSLHELIDRTVKKIEPLEAVNKIQIALDVAVGVNYLHVEQEMVHRDLKPQNILICEGFRAKLCDFGSARKVGNVTLQNIGTMLFSAPEVFNQTEKITGSYAADVYSFGVILWCLFFETKPPGMRETMPPKTIPTVVSEKEVAKDVLALVKECCEVRPESRVSMKEVVDELKKILVELKSRNYQKVVNELVLLKSEFAQKEAALNSRNAELQKGLKVKENENRKLEKSLKQVHKEAAAERVENKRFQNILKVKEQELMEKESAITRLERVLKNEAAFKELEIKRLKKDLEKALRESRAKSKKLEEMVVATKKKKIKSSVTIRRGFMSQRGILVPQNVVFEVNRKYRSKLGKHVFSNGNKVAKGVIGTVCFKTSAVFTAGKKFYFQVSANIGNGRCVSFGILSGEVTTYYVGSHRKGWCYHCNPEGGLKRIHHNTTESSGYGDERTLGKHTFGIFCDFTGGKGEVSFIVDGKNWGVAYRNVEPPVSPAFSLCFDLDSFKIEDTFEVPDCI